jgi:hypothetical protein
MEQGSEAAGALLAAAHDAFLEAGFCTGEFAEARRLAEDARAWAAGQDDPVGAVRASILLGYVLHYQNLAGLIGGQELDPGTVAEEEELFLENLAICEELGDEVGTARAAFGLGLVEQVFRHNWEASLPRYLRAQEFTGALEAAGDLYMLSEIERHLGFYLAFAAKQSAEARARLTRSLELREQLGDRRVIPSGLEGLAWVEQEAGNLRRAAELLRETVALSHKARLLPARIERTEQTLRDAEAVLAAQETEA